MIDTHKKGDESFIMSAVNVFGDNWRRTMDKQTKAAVLDAVKERFHAEMMFYDQAHQQTQSIDFFYPVSWQMSGKDRASITGKLTYARVFVCKKAGVR